MVFNHKSRLLSFTSSVASLRFATRFAITSDERSAPVVTSIRHWCYLPPAHRPSPVVTCHRHIARHWLLPATGTSPATGCNPSPAHRPSPVVTHSPSPVAGRHLSPVVTCHPTTDISPVTGCNPPPAHRPSLVLPITETCCRDGDGHRRRCQRELSDTRLGRGDKCVNCARESFDFPFNCAETLQGLQIFSVEELLPCHD